jgi:hypothetical protein
MDLEEFLQRLQKVRYFEGYAEAASSKALRAIRKNYAAGITGAQRADFERFPGLALVVTDVDLEMTGQDDLKDIVRQFGAASYGLFRPRAIKIRRKEGETRYRLQFSVNDTAYDLPFEDDSWIPNDFFETLEKVTKKECSGLAFQAVEYPDPGQSGFFVLCTPRALKAIERAGLIPSHKHPLSGEVIAEPMPATPIPEQSPEPGAEFALPDDPVRAERLGVFVKGKWRIPRFSKKAVAAWREVARAHVESLSGVALTTQIEYAFDLICARHCGIMDLGDATIYARLVVALVQHYFYGAWRDGHVTDGLTLVDGLQLTTATAFKQLPWDTELQAGCTAAILLKDDESLRRFLEYPCHDIKDEYMQHTLAYYRLLSDIVRKRSDWDWKQQAAITAKGFDKRLPKLMACLLALKNDDSPSFQEAIRKFATKPAFLPPYTFAGVIDCDVTILVELARQRGWPCDDFPERLQDKILDPRW